MMERLRLGLVTCGFLGCSPVAPGTVGTLGGVAIAWALATTEQYLLWVFLTCVAVYLIGRSLAPWAERRGGKDPQIFVLDEVLGYLITVAWIKGPTLVTLLVGFALFRFFDVLKPPPVRQMERFPGGDGILLDDVVAGLFGLIILTVARFTIGDAALWEVH